MKRSESEEIADEIEEEHGEEARKAAKLPRFLEDHVAARGHVGSQAETLRAEVSRILTERRKQKQLVEG